MLSLTSADDPEIDLKVALSDLQSAIAAVTPNGDRRQDDEAHSALDHALKCQRRVCKARQSQENQAA